MQRLEDTYVKPMQALLIERRILYLRMVDKEEQYTSMAADYKNFLEHGEGKLISKLQASKLTEDQIASIIIRAGTAPHFVSCQALAMFKPSDSFVAEFPKVCNSPYSVPEEVVYSDEEATPKATTLPPVPALEEAQSSPQSLEQKVDKSPVLQVVEKPATFLSFPVSVPSKGGAQVKPGTVSSNKRKLDETQQNVRHVGKGGNGSSYGGAKGGRSRDHEKQGSRRAQRDELNRRVGQWSSRSKSPPCLLPVPGIATRVISAPTLTLAGTTTARRRKNMSSRS